MRCALAAPMTFGKCTEEQPSGVTLKRAKACSAARSAITSASQTVVAVTGAPMAGPFMAATRGL